MELKPFSVWCPLKEHVYLNKREAVYIPQKFQKIKGSMIFQGGIDSCTHTKFQAI